MHQPVGSCSLWYRHRGSVSVWGIRPFCLRVHAGQFRKQPAVDIGGRSVWRSYRNTYVTHDIVVECIKTTSMETVGTGILEKNKEHYLRSKDKATHVHGFRWWYGTASNQLFREAFPTHLDHFIQICKYSFSDVANGQNVYKQTDKINDGETLWCKMIFLWRSVN